MLNGSETDGRMAILMVTGHAQGRNQRITEKSVKQSRARCPTYNREKCEGVGGVQGALSLFCAE